MLARDGRLQIELELLNNNLSPCDARDLRKLVNHDHKQVSISRQYALLGLPRSTLFCRRRSGVRVDTTGHGSDR